MDAGAEPRTRDALTLDREAVSALFSSHERDIIARALKQDLARVQKARDNVKTMGWPTPDADTELFLLEGRDGTPGLIAVFATQTFMAMEPGTAAQLRLDDVADGLAAATAHDDAYPTDADGIVWGESVPFPRPSAGQVIRYPGGTREPIQSVVGYEHEDAVFLVVAEDSTRYAVVWHCDPADATQRRGEWRLNGAKYESDTVESSAVPDDDDDAPIQWDRDDDATDDDTATSVTPALQAAVSAHVDAHPSTDEDGDDAPPTAGTPVRRFPTRGAVKKQPAAKHVRKGGKNGGRR